MFAPFRALSPGGDSVLDAQIQGFAGRYTLATSLHSDRVTAFAPLLPREDGVRALIP
jgi:hypothetical protein